MLSLNILRYIKPYHEITKTRAWLVRHVKGKTKVCVCINLHSTINHAVLIVITKFHNILFHYFCIVILFKKLLEVYSFTLYQDLVHPLLTAYFQQRNSSFAWKEEAGAVFLGDIYMELDAKSG